MPEHCLCTGAVSAYLQAVNGRISRFLKRKPFIKPFTFLSLCRYSIADIARDSQQQGYQLRFRISSSMRSCHPVGIAALTRIQVTASLITW